MSDSIKRVIIDTDPGVDDAHALMIFLEAEKRKLIKIEAITLTAGNTSIENSCQNILRLLETENCLNIPIYKGVNDALLLHNSDKSTYFGLDGFGDVFEEDLDLSIIREEPSSIVIKDIVNKNPGEITLVCLGPLTNVAIAAKLDSTFFDKVKECFIMGGNHQGRGNETASGEFNFYVDPEAAYIVLQALSCSTTILPIEPCYDASIPINWRWEYLGKCSRMDLLNKIEQNRYPFTVGQQHMWAPADGFLAMVILYPEVIIKKSEQHVSVELHGSLTRGQMVLDHLKKNQPNAVIIEEINAEFYKTTCLNLFQDKS